jgi:ATP-dependent DNA helicase RecQ
MLRREPERAPRPARARAAGAAAGARETADLPPEAEPVFERLRAWRAAAAKEQGVPAYVVFHDSTLREIATTRPSSLAQLATVNGVGEAKLHKYGQLLLDALAQ